MATNRKKDNVVIIFAKRPELGKVKTRIANETSSEFAFEFAQTCFSDLLNKINHSDYYDLIVGVDTLADLQWFQKHYSLEGIVINVLGGKSKQAAQSSKFEVVFSMLLNQNGYRYKKAILIPMDIPFISEEDLITAFTRLDTYKFTHGPEVNGGVYLIGVKGPYKRGIFNKVRWSTSHSFEDLVNNCTTKATFILKLKSDLNMPEDIIKLHDEIHYNCPTLNEFLKRNGYYLPVENRYVDFDDLSINIPVVVNIVRRKTAKGEELLVQTRYKPSIDPQNTGKLEIPSGLMKKYELAHDAAIRETVEETGIKCAISPDLKKVEKFNYFGDKTIAAYQPYFCFQQLQGDRAYVAMVFISDYVSGSLTESMYENRNPQWFEVSQIKKLMKKKPAKFFGLSFVALRKYFQTYSQLTHPGKK